MEVIDKRKSMSNKRKSAMSFPKSGKRGASFRKKSASPQMSDAKEDSFRRWDEIKEDMDDDNYIYGLHDEMVEKALEELRKKRSKEERIENFVESFCGAWLKLVRWRWMTRDNKGEDIVGEDDEPAVCPKDPWSSRSYGEVLEKRPRTTLPAPLRCCPHPPLLEVDERPVEKPAKERALRIQAAVKSDFKAKAEPGERFVQVRQSKIKTVTEPMIIPHMPPIPKTAFPERADAKIFMGPQVADKKKATDTAKTYTSEIDLTESHHEEIGGKSECQQYSRLDL